MYQYQLLNSIHYKNMQNTLEIGHQVLTLPKINSRIQVSYQRLNKLYYPNNKNLKLKQYYPQSSEKSQKETSKSVRSVGLSPLDMSKIIDDAQKISQIKYMMDQQKSENKNIFSSRDKKKFQLRQQPMKNKQMKEQILSFKKDNLLKDNKKAQQQINDKINQVFKQITPLNSSDAFLDFIQKSQNMKNLVKRSDEQRKKIQKILQSNKITRLRKFKLLEVKKKQVESEIQRTYQSVFSKYFSNEKLNEDSFKKKFQQNLRLISKKLVMIDRSSANF